MKNILSYIFPSRCPYCDNVVCEICQNNIKNENFVRIFKTKTFKLICLSSFLYEGKVKNAIWRYKFYDRKDYSKIFVKALKKSFKEKFSFIEFDFITNVPLSKARLLERGYDQAKILALELSKSIKIPYKNFLEKKKLITAQHTLDAKDRKLNSRGVYSSLNSAILNGKRILICDDVITTGSTLVSCTSVLKKAGSGDVYSITLASANLNV